MLTCKDALANLSCYLDGDGTEELRLALEKHIARCPRCWVVFDSTKKTLRIVTEANPFEVPLEVSARLYERLGRVLSHPDAPPA